MENYIRPQRHIFPKYSEIFQIFLATRQHPLTPPATPAVSGTNLCSNIFLKGVPIMLSYLISNTIPIIIELESTH